MCEINPKHKSFFRLEFFTSWDIPKEDWDNLLMEALLRIEMQINEKGNIRCHIHSETPEVTRIYQNNPP